MPLTLAVPVTVAKLAEDACIEWPRLLLSPLMLLLPACMKWFESRIAPSLRAEHSPTKKYMQIRRAACNKLGKECAEVGRADHVMYLAVQDMLRKVAVASPSTLTSFAAIFSGDGVKSVRNRCIAEACALAVLCSTAATPETVLAQLGGS